MGIRPVLSTATRLATAERGGKREVGDSEEGTRARREPTSLSTAAAAQQQHHVRGGASVTKKVQEFRNDGVHGGRNQSATGRLSYRCVLCGMRVSVSVQSGGRHPRRCGAIRLRSSLLLLHPRQMTEDSHGRRVVPDSTVGRDVHVRGGHSHSKDTHARVRAHRGVVNHPRLAHGTDPCVGTTDPTGKCSPLATAQHNLLPRRYTNSELHPTTQSTGKRAAAAAASERASEEAAAAAPRAAGASTPSHTEREREREGERERAESLEKSAGAAGGGAHAAGAQRGPRWPPSEREGGGEGGREGQATFQRLESGWATLRRYVAKVTRVGQGVGSLVQAGRRGDAPLGGRASQAAAAGQATQRVASVSQKAGRQTQRFAVRLPSAWGGQGREEGGHLYRAPGAGYATEPPSFVWECIAARKKTWRGRWAGGHSVATAAIRPAPREERARRRWKPQGGLRRHQQGRPRTVYTNTNTQHTRHATARQRQLRQRRVSQRGGRRGAASTTPGGGRARS